MWLVVLEVAVWTEVIKKKRSGKHFFLKEKQCSKKPAADRVKVMLLAAALTRLYDSTEG